MDQATRTQREPRTSEELIAEWRQLQAEIRADHPDMTEEDWDEFADRWAEAVNEGPRERVRKLRHAAG